MRKGVILAVATIFTVSLFAGVASERAFAKEYKIGYVDLAKVFDDYKKTKDSEKALEDKAKVKEAERKKMIDELRKLKDEQALLSEKAKAEKQKDIDEKISALQESDKKIQAELMKERNDLLSGIMKDIEKVIAAYSKEAGYDIILNARMMLYGSEQYDVTNEILSRLNK